MYRNLFIAWYCLGVLVLVLVSALIFILFFGWKGTEGSLGFLGFLGLLPLFTLPDCRTCWRVFREEKYDERDFSYVKRAMLSGGIAGFASLGPTNVLVFHFYWSRGTDMLSMPVQVFWAPFHCYLMLTILAFSITLILLYYKGERAVEV